MNIPQEYFKAGKIASKICEEMAKKISAGDKVFDICNKVESMIKNLGGEPAFPCNIGINSITAHYTAEIDDENIIKNGDVVKIDLGVHVNGYIADTAFTISFNPDYDSLIKATNDVLKEAISMVRGGVRVGDIGRAIENGASKRGFRTISNLSGHLLQQYKIHGGVSIPNVWVANTPSLKAYEVYAIEPFLTTLDGAGLVVDDKRRNIYALIGRKRTGDKNLDFLVEQIWKRFRTLPFTTRWLIDIFDKNEIKKILDKLVQMKILHSYPVLVEASKKVVAQFEHTLTPTESGVIVLT
ncbi:MAG: type II methionyl aminopeptidase [archaeon]|nr:type II methionyl aminopeptidase [archaeon]MCP8314172.1 type II methionyl aminopeptidase [archaeon]